MYISVRDRFGSFRREDFARYMLRCVILDAPIEEKKLGAGLGLYLIAATTTEFVINILPGSVSEFICMLEPGTGPSLKLLSVSTHVPLQQLNGPPAES